MRGVLRYFLAAIFVALSTSLPALAQPEGESDIVVEGRLREIVREFVTEASEAPAAEDQLGRWHNRICPGVIGIQARYGQFIADRIAEKARDVGLRPQPTGCKANLVVIVTPDADRLAEAMVSQFQEMVGATGEAGVQTLGLGELRDFVTSDEPVRWWHVARTVAADGNLPLARRNSSIDPIPAVRTTGTRFERATRQDFQRVLIIVDARQSVGITFDGLAEYIAMVSLAQLSSDVEGVEVPSILNLFLERDAGRAPPTGMSEWDTAYLNGLYRAQRNATSVEAQERQMIRRMVRELER